MVTKQVKYPLIILILVLMGCDQAPPSSEAIAKKETALEHAVKHTDVKYICPMHPQIVRDEPGNCPLCGMALVKKTIEPKSSSADSAKSVEKTPIIPKSHPSVTISPTVMQNMGVRLASVQYGSIIKNIKTVGYVTYNEDTLAHLHSRASGWVEKLFVRAEGDLVKENDTLLELYSPEILTAQVDFLVALRLNQTAIPNSKHDDARNRLRLLKVPESVIKQIEKEGKSQNTTPMLAPQSGIVTRFNIREGMYVTPEMEIFTFSDLSTVWVMVEVFEQQLAWVKPGLSAKIEVPAYPGQIWQGKVEYLYPELDPKTRTLKVRLQFPNPDQRLKPNMFAQVIIDGEPRSGILKIPQEALIVTGERKSVVVALGGGQFQPVDVTTGIQREGEVEILSGLQQGQQVVVSGHFLIDSESHLQASFSRLSPSQE